MSMAERSQSAHNIPNTIENTTAYRRVAINLKIKACDDLLSLISRKEKLQEDNASAVEWLEKAEESLRRAIEKEKQNLDRIKQQVLDTQSRINELETSQQKFTNGEIPESVIDKLEQARIEAEEKVAADIDEANRSIEKLLSTKEGIIGKLRNTNEQLKRAIEDIEELEKVRSLGLGSRILSLIWWKSFTYDFNKTARIKDENRISLEGEIEELEKSITETAIEVHKLSSSKESTVSEAVKTERSRQRELCEIELVNEKERLKELQQIDTISGEKIDALEALKSQVSEAQQLPGEKNDEKAQPNEFNQRDLPEVSDNVFLESFEEYREQILANNSAIIETESEIKAIANENGIDDCSEEGIKLLLSDYSILEKQLTREYSDSSSSSTGERNDISASIVSGDMENVTGNIYLDFDKNAENSNDRNGRFYQGLKSQLEELRKKHETLFPTLADDSDILREFQNSFFPNGFSQTYLVCNLSFKDGQPYIAVRPKYIGPRLEQIVPRGMTLTVCCRLWDHKSDRNNPVLLVQRITDLSHSDAREFEREIKGVVYCDSRTIYPGRNRERNIFSNDFVSSLPEISTITKERLKDWLAYLDWKERLIKNNLSGLRYIEAETIDGTHRFLVVAKSEETFNRFSRTFRNNDLRAFGLGYSLDPWEFKYNEKHRGNDTELGDYIRYEKSNIPDANTDETPWENPFYANVYFRFSEDEQDEYDDFIESGGPPEAALERLRRHPSSGFLALSVVGDMSLINRQRRELELLQQQSGYAPFLSSYIFDINSANKPDRILEIPEDAWFRRELNEDQKLAVRKMISAPDLAMVQGPPGTGKTTMIAEATWQFIRQRKKVLLVSQANLAVDNALERLAEAPSVRGIRLGRKGEEECPFSQARVLKTYYTSIANACRNRSLDNWTNADNKIANLRKWLETADLLYDDVLAMRKNKDELCSEQQRIENELSTRKTESDEAKRSRADAARFFDILDNDNGDAWDGILTNSILEIFFSEIVLPIGSLESEGIRLNRLWSAYDYGKPLEKSRFAVAILREFRDLERLLPQLEGDLERLKASKEEKILAPENAIRLHELEHNLKDVLEQMEDDSSKVNDYQAIQKEIREVKRMGSGLDHSTYSRIFNTSKDGVTSHTLFTDPNSSRIEVIEYLERSLEAIGKAQNEVRKGIGHVKKELESYMQNLVVSADDSGEKRLEGQLRDITNRIKELNERLVNKESRLLDLINEQPRTNNNVSIDLFPEIRNAVEEQYRSSQDQLEQSSAFRNSWEDILSDWVSDLTREETINNDQSSFLPLYIRYCNVIGATCTENRKTLEDAGHMWFDVVIIDEVSKATPTEIIMPLMMGRTAILVGDHRQLPPLFKEKEGSWEEAVIDQEEAGEQSENGESDLTEENFERFRMMVTSSLFKEHFENAPEELRAFLFTQYRMHPQIMQIVNQFYENRLQCGLTDPDGIYSGNDTSGHRTHGMTLIGPNERPYITPEHHVVWIDSTYDPCQERHYERREKATSKVNDLEAVLIAKCLMDIEKACRKQGYGRERIKKQIGVITFYARQIRAIRNSIKRLQQLEDMEFSAIRVDVNTVDRYQGKERPIIIVSMVRNPRRKLSPRANTAQFERVNVAFSRAQELLIITGAKDVFCNYPINLAYLDKPGRREVNVYQHIVDEINRSGGFNSANNIIDREHYRSLSNQRSDRPISPERKRGDKE